jgi:hypothetical protein
MKRIYSKVKHLVATGNLIRHGIQWMKYKRKLVVYRFSFRFGSLSRPQDIRWQETLFENPLMVLPGSPDFISEMFRTQQADPQQDQQTVFTKARQHKAAILSHNDFDLGENAPVLSPLFFERVKELPPHIVASYKPINWHRDFTSGKEWVGGYLYFDKINFPKAGSDIKVPWELSRFVHIGALTYGNQEDAGHEFLLQTADWITSNPDYTGINWSSELIVSIRAVNWIWAISLYKPVLLRYPKLMEKIVHSLYEHRRYLEKNMAFYTASTDDHYLSNLVALAYISLAFPDFPDADQWLLFSYRQLCSEMKRQVHEDGLSYMMSTGYHRFVTELFCSAVSYFERIPDARRKRVSSIRKLSIRPDPATMIPYGTSFSFPITGKIFPEWFYAKLSKMGNVIRMLSKPDDRITQIGDNDSARAHKLRPVLKYDTRKHLQTALLVSVLCNDNAGDVALPDESQEETVLLTHGIAKHSFTGIKGDNEVHSNNIMLLKESQIAVYRTDNIYVAMLCPPNGYYGLGGHGHNDKCSFELNVKGADFFVDAGCPYYTSDVRMRNAYRSVSAHTTFLVDNIEQDPIDDAEVFLLNQTRSNPVIKLAGTNQVFSSHDGFGVTCSRRYTFLQGSLTIEDTVPVQAKSKKINFNLHPDVSIISISRQNEDHIAVLQNQDITLQLIVKNADGWKTDKGLYGTGYGEPVGTHSLQFDFSGDKIETLINY